MKKYIYPLLLILMTTFAGIATYKLSYFIGEKYFFDKLFYKKSAAFGYTQKDFNYFLKLNKDSPYSYYKNNDNHIVERLADLLLLTRGGSETQVLGTSAGDEFKIAVIGDSFVYGIGIRNEDRFSEVLDSLLGETRPTKTYVLGLSGDNFLEYSVKYNLAEKVIKPDLYIIGIVSNDFFIDKTDRYPTQEELFDKLKENCPGDIFRYDRNGYEKTWEEKFLESYYPSATEDYSNSCLLTNSISEMDLSRTLFFPISPIQEEVVLLPDYYNNRVQELELKQNWLMQKYGSIIESLGGYILLYDYSDIPTDLLRVSDNEGHYSKLTNKKIAEKLYEEIITNSHWGFVR